MKFLVDTQLLLWAAGQLDKIPASARTLLEDPSNDLLFSAASIWEVVIKRALGRSSFLVDPHLLRRGLLNNGYTELAITGAHALAVASLPPLHKDPFDRILVAQATAQGALLLTTDRQVAQYPGPIRMV